MDLYLENTFLLRKRFVQAALCDRKRFFVEMLCQETLCGGNILGRQCFVKETFCDMKRSVVETFCKGIIICEDNFYVKKVLWFKCFVGKSFVKETFMQETFYVGTVLCHENVLWWNRFVKGNFKPPSSFVKKWSVFEKLAYKYGDRGGGTYLWV